MDEAWIRLAVVVAAAAVVVLVAQVARRRKERAWRALASTGLEPGLYLFTSAGCEECTSARAAVEALAGSSFVEVKWEERPQVFDELGVDVVPSTLIVSGDSSGRWYRGVPVSVIEAHNP